MLWLLLGLHRQTLWQPQHSHHVIDTELLEPCTIHPYSALDVKQKRWLYQSQFESFVSRAVYSQ